MRSTLIFKTTRGRDKDKTFKITEMSAESAEFFALRVLKANKLSDNDILHQCPLSQLASMGFKAILSVGDEYSRQLLIDMTSCVEFSLPSSPDCFNKLNLDEIEEPMTLSFLRKKIFDLHTNFFHSWRLADLDVKEKFGSAGGVKLASYANTVGIIATLISSKLATLNELQTIYGPYDAYRMLEIHHIDQINSARLNNANNNR